MSARRMLLSVGAVAWVALVVAARRNGLEIAETPRVAVGAAPVVGRWLWTPTATLLWPAAVAGVVVVFGPRIAARSTWRVLLLLTILAGSGWTASLALTEGTDKLTEPLETRYEYLAVLPEVDEVGVTTFISTYTERLGDYPTHVKGHPPGPTLVFVALDRVGLEGSGWATALVLGVGASAAAAVLVTLRLMADEPTARRAAPFLVLLPGAIWMGTSTDAMFAGVIAWGVALTAMAVRSQSPSRQPAMAAAAGVVVAIGSFMTYGAVPLLLIPAAIVASTRSWKVVPAAAAGAVVVVAAFLLAGFWWFDGVEATRTLYEAGVSQRREYGYFVFLGNPAAFALCIGPAVAAALMVLRDRRVWVLVGSALLAVVVADLSGLSKGEVERIWLPFVPWVAAATVALRGRFGARAWLAAQAATALVVEAWLMSPW